MIPINGRDHMRESRGIVGNMNETEAAWLCAEVNPAYVIPMHYECIAGNTGDPGHFTTLVRESGAPAIVLVPPRATPFTLALRLSRPPPPACTGRRRGRRARPSTRPGACCRPAGTRR